MITVPANFYTTIIQKDSRFHSTYAINDPALLEPVFRAIVISIIADALAEGTSLRILETFRSQERQEQLFNQGATELQTVGVHHYGLACDLGIWIGGSLNWKTDYSILQRLSAKHGIVSGADWGTPGQPHSFRDYDHVQRIAVADQPQLFAGTWYPDSTYRAPQVG